MSQGPPAEPVAQRTVSEARRSRWPGWIWAVPLAAIGIVIWLLVRATTKRGVDVTVMFDDATGLSTQGTKVLYRGVDVGQVSGIELSEDRRHVTVTLDIDKRVQADLTSGTGFYLEGSEPSLTDLSSLKAVVAGPSIIMLPGRGTPTRRFVGMPGPPPKPIDGHVSYTVTFTGDVGDLEPGAPVRLRGFTVGEVARSELSIDAQTAAITTPVVLWLDPKKFHIVAPAPADGNWVPQMNATLATLVQHNLRARLTQVPPLIGPRQIELAIVPGATEATLRTRGPYPEIPTAADTGLGNLPRELGQLPIRQIGDNIRAITERVRSLVSSPKLDDSIAHLQRTLAELDKTLQDVQPQVGPTLDSVHRTIDTLRHAAGEIDATTASARQVMGASALSPDGNLQDALRELSGAARSIRLLASYLDEHPEALLRGHTSEASIHHDGTVR
jgi:paraquat-inducible protein B